MNDSQKIMVLIPLIIVASAIAVLSTKNESSTQTLSLKGYNFGNDLAQLSVAIANEGTEPVTIRSISVDGVELGLGEASKPATLGTGLKGFSGSELVFAPYGKWRCSSVSDGKCLLMPRSVVTLYLGIGWERGKTYVISVITDKGNYSFLLKSPP
ncbi:MAG: hypothetical protein QXR26_07085 [Candidatus Caldarchaeum sp.]